MVPEMFKMAVLTLHPRLSSGAAAGRRTLSHRRVTLGGPQVGSGVFTCAGQTYTVFFKLASRWRSRTRNRILTPEDRDQLLVVLTAQELLVH